MKTAFLVVLLYAASCVTVNAANPPDAYKMAIKLFQQGEQKKAFGVADELINKKNSEAWGYRLRAELNHEQGRDDLAERDTKKAVDIAIKLFELNAAPTSATTSVKSMSEIISQTRAIDQSFSKAMSEADKTLTQRQKKIDLADVQKTIAKHPNDLRAIFKEAEAYQQRGDWKSALKALGKALSLEAKLVR